MHQTELVKYGLEPFARLIEAVSRPCIVGVASEVETKSYFGGLPTIDEDFTWPQKDGHPLRFVGQIKCSDVGLLTIDTGYLLFFYDNRHWGYSPDDRGHALVLHQQGERQATESDVPVYEQRSFLGLRRRRTGPQVYAKVPVTFQQSSSYPSLERDLITFGDDQWEEAYLEFCCEIQPLIQLGGYPSPIQSDCMEDDCVNALGFGRSADWQLLLQLFEVGDMLWGDAGALYWFIHKHDLECGRFDRVWMVTQCH